MEEPERGVGGVVEALLLAFREQVGDQAVADVVGEGAQDASRASPWRPVGSVSPSRLIIVSRPQSVNQWIAGDDGADLVALRRRAGPRPRRGRAGVMMNWSAASTSSRPVGILQRRSGLRNQPPPPLVLEPDRLRGVDLAQPRPLFGRGGEDHLGAGRDVELGIEPERQQAAQPVVAAGALGPVGDVDQPVVVAPAGRRGRLRAAAAAAAAVR